MFKSCRMWLIALFLAWGTAGVALAGEAMDQLSESVQKTVSILNNPELKAPEKLESRREQLRNVIFFRFNFNKMAQATLGIKWKKLDQNQKTRFVELFTKVLEDTYMGKIETFEAERVDFTKEFAPGQGFVQVDSQVLSRGQPYKMSYRLTLEEDNQWRVFDVIVEGVSLVANYRSQFQEILRGDSPDNLISQLEQKLAKKGTLDK